MPLRGGIRRSRYGSRYRRKRTYRARSSAASRIQRAFRTRRSFKSRVRSAAITLAEPKRSNHIITSNQLYHNVTWYYTNLLFTEQGGGNPQGLNVHNNNRIGNEIILRGFSMKLWLENAVDHPNIRYRCLIYMYNPMHQPVVNDSVLWNGTDGQGSNMNRMLDSANKARITVLRDFMLTTPVYSETSTSADLTKPVYCSRYVSFNNKRIQYAAPNSGVPFYRDLGVAVIAYDAQATLQTDLISQVSAQISIFYRDP